MSAPAAPLDAVGTRPAGPRMSAVLAAVLEELRRTKHEAQVGADINDPNDVVDVRCVRCREQWHYAVTALMPEVAARFVAEHVGQCRQPLCFPVPGTPWFEYPAVEYPAVRFRFDPADAIRTAWRDAAKVAGDVSGDIQSGKLKPAAFRADGQGAGPPGEREGYLLWRGSVCGAREVWAELESRAQRSRFEPSVAFRRRP